MRKALLLLAALALTMNVLAGNRSKAVMLKLAKQHMSLHNKDAAGEVKLVAERPMMAVYSDGMQFSIISRDDSYDAVLAYGAGEFDVENAPANVKWWMTAVEEALAKGVTTRRASSYTAVSPLMTTKWGQDEPYNNLAPEVKDEDKKTVKAPCGCIATAMGQILNHNAYPAAVDFMGFYTIGESEDSIKEQVTETFSWPYKLAYGAYLPDGYKSVKKDVKSISYTEEEGSAVARLIRACGLSAGMNYDWDGSGVASYDASIALVEKFQYPDKSLKWLNRMYYTTDEWLGKLNKEMVSGSPILYGGYDKENTYGHAFVLHGMDSDGKVYVNWGWQGIYDGYYAIDLMAPEEGDFSYGQDAVMGVRSTTLPIDEYTSFWTTDKVFDLQYKSSKLTLTLKDFLRNSAIYDFKGDLRFCVVDSVTADTTQVYKLFSNEVIGSYYGWPEDTELFKKNISFTSGHTYMAFMESKDNRESEWQRVRTDGGTFYHSIVCSESGKVTINNKVESGGGTTGIVNVAVEDSAVKYYSLDGKPLHEMKKGINLVRMGNGEVRKVVVK